MDFKNLKPQQFKEAIDTKENIVILDVRTVLETASGTINNAIVVDLLSIDFKEIINAFDKDKSYYVYCKSGSRSKLACQLMSQMGFSDLVNLEGGIQAFQQPFCR